MLLCFFIFFFFLFFGLIRKWTVLHAESQVVQISFQVRTLNHTYTRLLHCFLWVLRPDSPSAFQVISSWPSANHLLGICCHFQITCRQTYLLWLQLTCCQASLSTFTWQHKTHEFLFIQPGIRTHKGKE